jgi:hypothetical protein
MVKKVIGRWAVELPGHTARLNELIGSWRKAARLKKRDRGTVALACRLARVPPAAGKRLASLHVVLGPRQRAGDPDCYFKSLGDALVACGALRDDNRQGVEWAAPTFSRGPKAGMVITLTDLEG